MLICWGCQSKCCQPAPGTPQMAQEPKGTSLASCRQPRRDPWTSSWTSSWTDTVVFLASSRKKQNKSRRNFPSWEVPWSVYTQLCFCCTWLWNLDVSQFFHLFEIRKGLDTASTWPSRWPKRTFRRWVIYRQLLSFDSFGEIQTHSYEKYQVPCFGSPSAFLFKLRL